MSEKPQLRIRIGRAWLPVPARFLHWRLQKNLEKTWAETQKEMAAAWGSPVPVRLKRKAPTEPRYRATFKGNPLQNALAAVDGYEREELAHGGNNDGGS